MPVLANTTRRLILGAVVFVLGLVAWTKDGREYALILGAPWGWAIVLPWGYSKFIEPVEIGEVLYGYKSENKWLFPVQGEVEQVFDDHYVVKDSSGKIDVVSHKAKNLHVGDQVWVLGVRQQAFPYTWLLEHLRYLR